MHYASGLSLSPLTHANTHGHILTKKGATYRVVEDLEITGCFPDDLAVGHMRPEHIIVHSVSGSFVARPKNTGGCSTRRSRRACHTASCLFRPRCGSPRLDWLLARRHKSLGTVRLLSLSESQKKKKRWRDGLRESSSLNSHNLARHQLN